MGIGLLLVGMIAFIVVNQQAIPDTESTVSSNDSQQDAEGKELAKETESQDDVSSIK